MRKLASVRIIREISAIPNADKIELAKIDNWQTIIRKNTFKVGDKVVYCEIDSFLPVKPEYEFLRNTYKRFGNNEGFYIKTIRLKGVLSQGLVLALPKELLQSEIGTDCTDYLGIKHYDDVRPNLEDVKGASFPYFIPKTNEERIQNLDYTTLYTAEHNYTVTEKLDGTSFTAYNYNGKLGVCSRRLELDLTITSIYTSVFQKYNLSQKLALMPNIAIQGEIIGPGVQGNPYKLHSLQLYVFKIYDIVTQTYISNHIVPLYLSTLGLTSVPIISSSFVLPETGIDDLIAIADGESYINPKVNREGVVLLSNGKEVNSFKIISNKWLLGE